MKLKEFDILLDIKKTKKIEYIEIVQGDYESNVFNISVVEDLEPYSLTGLNVEIAFAKPDGTTVSQDENNGVVIINAIEGKIICTLKTNTIAAPGKVLAEVRILQGSKLLTTARFDFFVRRAIVNDDTIKSTNEFPLLQRLTDDVQGVIATEEFRQNQEQIRIRHEQDRVTNETTRNDNEYIRRTNEIARVQAENARIDAEDTRNTHEDNRLQNETIRAENEDGRVLAENTRVENEKNRVLAENVRIEKEGIREENENKRVTAEDIRKQSETARVIAEQARIEAETDRVTAETNRENNFNQAIDDFIAETERVESLYPERLTKVEIDLVQCKQDCAQDKKPFQFDHAAQEYINIDKFWSSFKDGKIYTSEFYHHEVSPSSDGIKKDNNEGLVCEPSTNTVKGRNDYEKIGLFMSIDVNAYVDENDDYHVTAIKGDGRFKNDGTMGDVYVMAMPGYQKRYSNDEVWGISYSDTMHPGFEILDEAVKPDGTIRPYLLHAKYVAGRNPYENNNLASISGVYPEYIGMSHNGQIDKFKEKGVQYSGKTSHDDYYVQLMFWLKYATLNSQSIMSGCQYYWEAYENLVPETGVKRVILTNAQANRFLIGSTVSIGDYGDGEFGTSRSSSTDYNLAERVNITDIVDLGDGNSAVYVNSPNTFDTTLTTTIKTYPWNSGGCDNVLGQDGSPYDNQSGKEPFIINGIEIMVGGYEIIQNLIIYNNNKNPDDYKIQVYACYDCTKYSTSPTGDYDLVGYELVQTNASWKYISKIGIDPNNPSVLIPIDVGASSTTGFADGAWTNTPTTGYREWRSLGHLSNGALGGLRSLFAVSDLGGSYWSFLGRLSATGRSRRRAGVN